MVSVSTTTQYPERIKPKPNCFLAMIDSLSYQGNDDNLVEIKIRDISFDEIFKLNCYSHASLDYNSINITNINQYKNGLQRALNNGLMVRIFHENGEIVRLELIAHPAVSRSCSASCKTYCGGCNY